MRATPFAFGQFAWALTRRALLHQLLGAALGALAASALGAEPVWVLYLAAVWMCVVVLVYVLAATEAYRGRSPLVRIALSLATLLAIESRAHAWSIPAALLCVAWRLRRAIR